MMITDGMQTWEYGPPGEPEIGAILMLDSRDGKLYPSRTGAYMLAPGVGVYAGAGRVGPTALFGAGTPEDSPADKQDGKRNRTTMMITDGARIWEWGGPPSGPVFGDVLAESRPGIIELANGEALGEMLLVYVAPGQVRYPGHPATKSRSHHAHLCPDDRQLLEECHQMLHRPPMPPIPPIVTFDVQPPTPEVMAQLEKALARDVRSANLVALPPVHFDSPGARTDWWACKYPELASIAATNWLVNSALQVHANGEGSFEEALVACVLALVRANQELDDYRNVTGIIGLPYQSPHKAIERRQQELLRDGLETAAAKADSLVDDGEIHYDPPEQAELYCGSDRGAVRLTTVPSNVTCLACRAGLVRR